MSLINCPECGKEISDKATSCPNCGSPVNNKKTGNSSPVSPVTVVRNSAPEKKKGSCLKTILIAFGILVLLGVIGNIMGGGSEKKEEEQKVEEEVKEEIQETESNEDKEQEITEEEKPIEYISVTATELSNALSNNAMKAQNDYKGKYLEITGKLGNIDSNGKYIGINSDKDFDLTNIQCYIKSDDQKQVIMEMSSGDTITVKGYCKDIGEILGYQIDIDEIEK